MKSTIVSWIQGSWKGDVASTQAFYLEKARSLKTQKPDLVVLP
jgi:hypothetical protein